MNHRDLIARMTLEEKVALCSGADFFSTRAFAQYGIPSITMVDGPHGLRKQTATADHLGVNESVPATCFPTASLTACSWDRVLLREMGAAIAEEALQEGVSIVLGPGANLKRNPLCGRNFEYFSEDPVLAGEMAAAWIRGLQSRGVGASLKHVAANNQERERMTSDSLVDERALRELYLPAFELAVRAARPATVMCAYNKLNGITCSDHVRLLREILRETWGFEGVILTDWGAMNDRVRAFEAGVDLEMPGSEGHFDAAVIRAIRDGTLSEQRLDESVDRLLDLVFAAADRLAPGTRYDVDAHHALAKRIAVNSAVLLKNEDGILPLPREARIALIGALAREPRYQGTGSSHINPTRLDSLVDGFQALGLDFVTAAGYRLDGTTDEALLAEAAAGARAAEAAVVVAGLPEAYESEGFDRESLAMPAGHIALIERAAAANPRTVVVLVGGAPVEMPWLPRVNAVLALYLAGQAGGPAAAELLVGLANPSGKLAETWPVAYTDVPSAGFYEAGGKQAQYREGLYVGARYYDKARIDVLFPFGHGLSYTAFDYRDLIVSSNEIEAPYDLTVSATVENRGGRDGAEVVQVYVGAPEGAGYRPVKELKAFEKVWLRAGEARRVSFNLDARSFAVFDPEAGDWVVPGGVYPILVGASSRDIRLRAEVRVRGGPDVTRSPSLPAWYREPRGPVSQAEFEALLGREIPPVEVCRKGAYTLECSFQEMKDSFIIRQVMKAIERTIAKRYAGAGPNDPTFRLVLESSTGTPLKRLSQLSPREMPLHVTQGLVHLANGKLLRGIASLLGVG